MRRKYIVQAGVLVAATMGMAAIARGAPPAAYDPAQLPATKGTVTQYSLTPRGDVDGLLLADGTEIHLPPHLGAQLVYTVKPGDAITVRGLKLRASPIVEAVSVTNDATNKTVLVTEGGPRDEGQPLTAQGRVTTQLHGPRGDLNGVLLDSGTIVRLPPPEAERLTAQLANGQTIFVRGTGTSGPLGTVIAAQAIGPNESQLAQIQTPPPRGKKDRDLDRDRRGPPPAPPKPL